ncbi:hypothetical protein VCHC42A1_1871, partial [Vibrio cholerae HC-42A1]
MGGKR